MNMIKKTDGFTLVELIVVIAILAILAVIAVPAYSGYISKAEEAGDTQIVSAINTAIHAATAAYDAEADTVSYDATKGITITFTGDDAADALEAYKMYIGANSTIMKRFNTFKIENGLLVASYVKPTT